MQSNRTVPVISFDLDGTLVTTGFANAVWLDEIPRRYARRHRTSRSRAQREVERAYASIGPEALEWYDIHYWLDRFDLDADWRELLRDRLGDLCLYEDVSGTLDALAGYRLIDKEEFRLLHDCHGDLEPLLLTVRQVSGLLVGLFIKINVPEHCMNLVPRRTVGFAKTGRDQAASALQ